MRYSPFHMQVHSQVRKEHFEKHMVALTWKFLFPLLKIYLCIMCIISKLQRQLQYANAYSFFCWVSDWLRHMVCRMLATVSFLALQIQEAIRYLYILLGTNTIQSPVKQLNFGSYPSSLSWLVYIVSWKVIT